MLNRDNPWFAAWYDPKERHWNVYARLESDGQLIACFKQAFFPQMARIAVPADHFADNPSWLPYKTLVKEPKAAFALPGKLWPEFKSGSTVLSRVAHYYKSAKSRKEGEA